ncbi:MAG: hypothetical protein Q7T03_03050, partial [Deltaproteobacteria bacterium]|nr:hypothetical protein [Deltaproteobacteria bacterium]
MPFVSNAFLPPFVPDALIRIYARAEDTIYPRNPHFFYAEKNGLPVVETHYSRQFEQGIKAVDRLIAFANTPLEGNGEEILSEKVLKNIEADIGLAEAMAKGVLAEYTENGNYQQRGTEIFANLAWRIKRARELLDILYQKVDEKLEAVGAKTRLSPDQLEVEQNRLLFERLVRDKNENMFQAHQFLNDMKRLGVEVRADRVTLGVAIVGFDIKSLNTLDPTYETGDIAIGILRARIQETFGDAFSMYGNTKMRIVGVSRERLSVLCREIVEKVKADLMSKNLKVNIDWDRVKIGFSAGFSSVQIRFGDLVEEAQANTVRKALLPQISARLTREAAERQSEAEDIQRNKRTVFEIFGDPVPANSRNKGKGYQPELRPRGFFVRGNAPETLVNIIGRPLESLPTLRPEDVRLNPTTFEPGFLSEGIVLRPSHTGGVLIGLLRNLKKYHAILSQLSRESREGDVSPATRKNLLSQITILKQLFAQTLKGDVDGGKLPKGFKDLAVSLYEVSQRNLRYPNAFKMRFLEEQAVSFFGGKPGWIVMHEIKGLNGFLSQYPPSEDDAAFTLIEDILRRGTAEIAGGADNIRIGVRGDEYYILIRENKNLNHQQMYQKLLEIQNLFKKVFEELKYHRTVKWPGPGGKIRGIRFYVADNGDVYVEKMRRLPDQTQTREGINQVRAVEVKTTPRDVEGILPQIKELFGLDAIGKIHFVRKIKGGSGNVDRLFVWAKKDPLSPGKDLVIFSNNLHADRIAAQGLEPVQTTLEVNTSFGNFGLPGRIRAYMDKAGVAVDA